jgi:hypothetical protein
MGYNTVHISFPFISGINRYPGRLVFYLLIILVFLIHGIVPRRDGDEAEKRNMAA